MMAENKRFTVNYRENTRLYEVKDSLHKIDCGSWAFEYDAKQCCDELNNLHRENEQLKEEIQLLKDGMKAYENAIPYVCTCEQVRDINSEMFDFRMKQNKFYKEHPNRCTVIIDGVRYE